MNNPSAHQQLTNLRCGINIIKYYLDIKNETLPSAAT